MSALVSRCSCMQWSRTTFITNEVQFLSIWHLKNLNEQTYAPKARGMAFKTIS